MKKDTKQIRQSLLKEIVKERWIGDQNHLLNELEKQGVKTTQATISRDLQEMGFAKVRLGPGMYKYELIGKKSRSVLTKQLNILFQNFVVDIKGTNNMILIKTSPGNANSVASLVDNLEMPEVLGTIAGDDTILVVVESSKKREIVKKEFEKLMGKLPEGKKYE